MARKTPTTHKGKPLSRYQNRAVVETEYARGLDELNEELQLRAKAMRLMARIIKRARKEQRAGRTSPDVYRLVAAAIRMNADFQGFGFEHEPATTTAVMAEILTGEKIVDPYTGDFIDPGEPYGSLAAFKARLALRLAQAEGGFAAG